MEVIISGVIGALFGMGVYMVLKRSIVSLVFGFILLSHAANLFVFTIGGIIHGAVPIVEAGMEPDMTPDPLPQALILTAIVISFGLTAFSIVLVRSVYKNTGTADIADLNTTDKLEYESK
ncbi:MAG: NADH-quinone oxidoreductase subunit K [Cytophagaceae bacterium]